MAVTGTLLAETSVARAGLGLQAIHYYVQLRIPEMYALLLLVFLAAMLVNAGFALVDLPPNTLPGMGGQSVPIP